MTHPAVAEWRSLARALLTVAMTEDDDRENVVGRLLDGVTLDEAVGALCYMTGIARTYLLVVAADRGRCPVELWEADAMTLDADDHADA